MQKRVQQLKVVKWDTQKKFIAKRNITIPILTTVPARYLDLHKINNSSCNYLGSFFIENLNLKKHLINTKTAVLMTDFSKCDGFC